ncbi:E3 ubiquitin-protein ligase RNF213-like [Saccoglossus kowalevskii]
MMIVCTELRIPLFLVGKPGSSKSLAKAIVANAMQGDNASTNLFRTLKQVHMISYQCSPLSTPDGIINTFKQCGRLQEEKDLDRFVSVVVLDEIGLAEDSPKFPLKALHPLLENGSIDEDPKPHQKVAVIGISNWALDPAKMNRGILLSRGVPDEDELQMSASGICSSNSNVLDFIKPMIPSLANGYRKLYMEQDREFFGLRDFYSLVKMVYGFSNATGQRPTWHQLEHSIRRNFGGMDNTNPLQHFGDLMKHAYETKYGFKNDPEVHPSGLICASLHGLPMKMLKMDSDHRYLLVLTEGFAALGILQQKLLSMEDTVIMFGSSFPSDQVYTQVCRTINRIKVCMGTGRTVVLLNLDNLYESLYDALNQYYVEFGGERYVDLGLGNHRVKCRVHKGFRLIVVADKKVVFDRFPIPLINRLEKHYLSTATMLTRLQLQVVDKLDAWVQNFTKISRNYIECKRKHVIVEECFIGFTSDTPGSIVALVCDTDSENEADNGNDNDKWVEMVCAL